MDINKCNLNWESQYAYINKIRIHINDYINCELKNSNITCRNEHQLICANGDKNKSHFRHKNKNDMSGHPMTKWHCEWQGNFENTEVHYKKRCDKQIKDRIADVLIKEHNYILEFQHSDIVQNEVRNRKNDYGYHDINIIWIIDGNNNIEITQLNSGRVILEFVSKKWKYESFTDYDIIFIDINEKIYKVYPKYIKNHMIDVEPPIDKNVFIKYINDNERILHEINIPKQCNLYVKQQGAGNGKTYGLIQMLDSEAFSHYNCFMIVTKQHSAKTIIYNEFKTQSKNGLLKNIELHKDINNIDDIYKNKKYTIRYTNKITQNECDLVIATIDSLMWSLGDKTSNGINKFKSIVNSIIDGYITNNNINNIDYGGINIHLNKNICLISDETQDLTVDYAKAIYSIMRDRYIDSYIVGDKLQSISHDTNAFTYIMENDFSNVKTHKQPSTNICRRFNNGELIEFINSIVPFNKYNLPSIIVDNYTNYSDSFILLPNHEKNRENNINQIIEKNISEIMEHYKREVETNNYGPEDFLIITPFTSKNPLATSLETAINMYWMDKIGNNEYKKFAIFHKSEDGRSIDLLESEKSTRIVSIHTSKGDGRNVVFVINLTEKNLKKFSSGQINLVYESLLHVALTRVKKKLYWMITENGDEIHRRVNSYYIKKNKIPKIRPSISISKNIKYDNDVVQELKNNDNIFEFLKVNIINKVIDIYEPDDQKSSNVIDMGHHNIRYSSMLLHLVLQIMLNSNFKGQQLFAIFKNLERCNIEVVNNWGKYINFLKNDDSNTIYLLQMSKKGKDYIKYHSILLRYIKSMQITIKCIFKKNLDYLCPFECILLYYMIEIRNNGIYSDISINDMYNIIDLYSKSFDKTAHGHDYCECKKIFTENMTKRDEYLYEHYNSMSKLSDQYKIFLRDFQDIKWLMNHNIYFNGNTDDYTIRKKFKFLGYNEDHIFIVYFKPQINDLNINDIYMDSIFDNFLIENINKMNIGEEGDEGHEDKELSETDNSDSSSYNKQLRDYKKFHNKKIITVIFTLSNNDYVRLDWNDIEYNNLIRKNYDQLKYILKNTIKEKYLLESKQVLQYVEHYKERYKIKINKLLVAKIIKKYNEDDKYNNCPEFLKIYFRCLKKENVLPDNNYEEKLNEIIIESIDDFFDDNTNI